MLGGFHDRNLHIHDSVHDSTKYLNIPIYQDKFFRNLHDISHINITLLVKRIEKKLNSTKHQNEKKKKHNTHSSLFCQLYLSTRPTSSTITMLLRASTLIRPSRRYVLSTSKNFLSKPHPHARRLRRPFSNSSSTTTTTYYNYYYLSALLKHGNVTILYYYI